MLLTEALNSLEPAYRIFTMRRAVASLGLVLAIAAAIPFLVAPVSQPRAQSGGEVTFLIPASDGYGVGDCLSTGAECGRVVADAWCEAQGFARAARFGQVAPEDVTASTGSRKQVAPVSVTCAG